MKYLPKVNSHVLFTALLVTALNLSEARAQLAKVAVTTVRLTVKALISEPQLVQQEAKYAVKAVEREMPSMAIVFRRDLLSKGRLFVEEIDPSDATRVIRRIDLADPTAENYIHLAMNSHGEMVLRSEKLSVWRLVAAAKDTDLPVQSIPLRQSLARLANEHSISFATVPNWIPSPTQDQLNACRACYSPRMPVALRAGSGRITISLGEDGLDATMPLSKDVIEALLEDQRRHIIATYGQPFGSEPNTHLVVMRDVLSDPDAFAYFSSTHASIVVRSSRESLLYAEKFNPARRIPTQVAVIQPDNVDQAKAWFGTDQIDGWNAFSDMFGTQAVRIRTKMELEAFLNSRRRIDQHAVIFCHQENNVVPLPDGTSIPLSTLCNFNAVFACNTTGDPKLEGVVTLRTLFWKHMRAGATAVLSPLDSPKSKINESALAYRFSTAYLRSLDGEQHKVENVIKRTVAGGIVGISIGGTAIKISSELSLTTPAKRAPSTTSQRRP